MNCLTIATENFSGGQLVLSQDQQTLDALLRTLSPSQVKQVIAYARGIARTKGESEDLSDANMAAIGADGLRRFAEEHPDDEWGYDASTSGA